MTKWIVLAVLVLSGLYVYRAYFYKSPAYKAYLAWDDAVSWGECVKLEAMAEGSAKDWVATYCGGRFSAAKMVSDLRNTPSGVSQISLHELKSEEAASDGTIKLVAISAVAGRRSNFSKPAPPRRHEVRLKQTGEEWKVLEYKDEEAKD